MPRSELADRLAVVVPMAGRGSRFLREGFDCPKPYIRIHGVPMVRWAMRSLQRTGDQWVLVGQRVDHDGDPEAVRSIEQGMSVTWVLLDQFTEGAACTVLAAEGVVDPDQPMLVANSDACIACGAEPLLTDALSRELDGAILVFKERDNPALSYAKVGPDDLVSEVAEKRPISEFATAGLYYFRRAGCFFEAARERIARGERDAGEFHVAPVYNTLVASGARVGVHSIPVDDYWPLNTPSDLGAFLDRLDQHDGVLRSVTM